MSTETRRKSRASRGAALVLLVAGNLWVWGFLFRRLHWGGGGESGGYEGVAVGSIWVPIGVREEMVGAGGPSWRVTMCLVAWDAYWKAPHDFGKYKQVQQASRCGDSKRQRVLNLAEAAYDAKRRGAAPLRPSGFIFQESRVGSTLLANILAALPHHLVYSEGIRLPTSARATRDESVAALRDYVTLLGAPAANSFE